MTIEVGAVSNLGKPERLYNRSFTSQLKLSPPFIQRMIACFLYLYNFSKYTIKYLNVHKHTRLRPNYMPFEFIGLNSTKAICRVIIGKETEKCKYYLIS